MKKYKIICIAMLFVGCSYTIVAQTTGILNFECTTSAPDGDWGKKHAAAIWIQNNENPSVFIKTKAKYGSDVDHLTSWTVISNKNLVDAVTGSTLTSYGNLSVQWDGTDVSQNVVMDGEYSIYIEMGWGKNKTADHAVKLFSFTKGSSAQNLSPEGTSNYSNISLSWEPTATLLNTVEDINGINVFPNPAKEIIQINFLTELLNAKVEVIDISGKILYTEQFQQTTPGIRTIDISSFSPGLYVVAVSSEKSYTTYKILVE